MSDTFCGWAVGDRCDHLVPGRSESGDPYDGRVTALVMSGGLPYVVVHWPDGTSESVLSEYLTPTDA